MDTVFDRAAAGEVEQGHALLAARVRVRAVQSEERAQLLQVAVRDRGLHRVEEQLRAAFSEGEHAPDGAGDAPFVGVVGMLARRPAPIIVQRGVGAEEPQPAHVAHVADSARAHQRRRRPVEQCVEAVDVEPWRLQHPRPPRSRCCGRGAQVERDVDILEPPCRERRA